MCVAFKLSIFIDCNILLISFLSSNFKFCILILSNVSFKSSNLFFISTIFDSFFIFL